MPPLAGAQVASWAGYAARSTTAMTTKRRSCTAASATFQSTTPRTALESHWRTSPIIECPEPQNVEMRLSESLRVVQGPIGAHRDFDRGKLERNLRRLRKRLRLLPMSALFAA